MSKHQPTRHSMLVLVVFSFVLALFLTPCYCAAAFTAPVSVPATANTIVKSISSTRIRRPKSSSAIGMSDDWNDSDNNSNLWRDSSSDSAASPNDSSNSNGNSNGNGNNDDWQEMLASKQDGSFWTTFEPAAGEEQQQDDFSNATASRRDEDEEAEAWLDTLASLSAEEVEFNMKENDRADQVRQMQEWGFEDQTIINTLDVAIDDSLEKDEVSDSMQAYRVQQRDQQDYDTDWKKVESHTKVQVDEETGEPVRQQMVYVDEHTCIGCTNCAMVAQSTFFMDEEHGRARVFNQWGDDDETIQIAIETCPVDCIHYIPYDELKRLEIDRRGQNINFKARLVSQAEYGGGESHRVGGANAFTAPQQISGNMGSRCNNCPSRGCKDCPMFGVGKNPEFERKEKERKARTERRRLEREREDANKSADL
jgi:ferredoxin